MHPSRAPPRRAVAAAGLLAAGFITFLALVRDGSGVANLGASLGLLVATVLAVGCCVRAALRETGRRRRAWALVAAFLAWAAGALGWLTAASVSDAPLPQVSLADLWYLGAFPLGVAALLSFTPAPASRSARFRTVMDGTVVAGSVLFVAWAFVLGPIYRSGAGGNLEHLVAVGAPTADVVLAAIAVALAAGAPRASRLPIALIAAAATLLAVGDALFASLVLTGGYLAGGPLDAGWFVASMLVGLAALTPSPAPAEAPARVVPTRRAAVVPYVPLAVAVGVAGVEQAVEGRIEPFLIWNGIFIVVSLIVRQVVTLLENISLARTLEEKVEARTAELTRARSVLEDALHELEEAQQVRETFVATVSHELRTPLTTIIAGLRTLLRPQIGLGPQGREIAEAGDRAAARLSDLIEDLLLAAGLAKEVRCARIPFDLGAELRRALAATVPRDRRLKARIPRSLPAVGDAPRVRVILEHLLSNAVKFGPPDAPIEVEAAAGPGRAEVAVHNQSSAIPEALRERIFEPFYQAGGGLTRDHGGAGLGLYLARQLAELMGGQVTLDEADGVVTFRLRLPGVEEETVRAKPQARAGASPRRRAGLGG